MKNLYQVTDFNYLNAQKNFVKNKIIGSDKTRERKPSVIDGRIVRMSVFSAITVAVVLLGALLFS